MHKGHGFALDTSPVAGIGPRLWGSGVAFDQSVKMKQTALIFVFILALYMPVRVPGQEATVVKGLAARYKASDLDMKPGEAVKTWRPSAGNREVPLVWQQTLRDGKKAVAPTLQMSNIMGFDHRSLYFAPGKRGEMELLLAKDLVADGSRSLTVFLVYRSRTLNTSGGSRIAGFGSTQLDKNASLKVWNIGVDSDAAGLGYGSFRFDGTFVGPHPGKVYPKGQLLIRAVVMKGGNRFTDYIQPAHDFFNIHKVAEWVQPAEKVGPFPGDFLVGDLHEASAGGGAAPHGFELFELQVFDRALAESEVHVVLRNLNWRYTNPEK